jgi:glycosyltransferase involved in cell wall biosynthesis
MADALGLREFVTFRGDLKGTDFEDALRPIQVVVMPSEWEETAGLAAMEQMMRGGVAVAADIGGLSEVVDGAGLKFAPGDSQALASCIHQVIKNPSLINSLGLAARARAIQFFNQDSMIQNHISLYR